MRFLLASFWERFHPKSLRIDAKNIILKKYKRIARSKPIGYLKDR